MTKKNKKIGERLYIPYFPAIDYYVYQKNGVRSSCDTNSIFLGRENVSSEVRLNYKLNYLPNLITPHTQHILSKVTSKEGGKPEFKSGVDPRSFKTKKKGSVKYIYDATIHGPNYTFYTDKIQNVEISKVVLNETGGITGYYCKYIEAYENIGVLHHTLLYPTNKITGEIIERFFNSDLVKFIFIITQYVSGKMQTNERLVANSITIPPIGVDDYYKYFEIDSSEREYIEDILNQFNGLKNQIPMKEEGNNPPRGEKLRKIILQKKHTTKSKKSLTKSLGKGAGRNRKKTLRRRRRSKHTTIKKKRLK